MRHAWQRTDASPTWTDRALQQDAGIGRWARTALLELSPEPLLEAVQTVPSTDGSTRYLWKLRDDELIESVVIPTAAAGHPHPRNTVCVSSQVGCARRCAFCESGRHGLRRQLGAAEIVDQVRLLRAERARQAGEPLTNIVFMGMGEPLDNLPTVCRAIRLLCDPFGFGFAPSHVTVSTVGIADRFAEFFASTRAELAVSLGAPDDDRRQQIIPAAQRFLLASIRDALLSTLPRGRRVLFQYALFDRFNDSLADADALAELVRPVRCRVNLLVANRGPADHLRAPSPERVHAFARRLHRAGVRTILRASRGADVGGACGQLAGAHRRDPLPSSPGE
jgi:23S rRNA (adenine2503-C2)-methyltransferase